MAAAVVSMRVTVLRTEPLTFPVFRVNFQNNRFVGNRKEAS